MTDYGTRRTIMVDTQIRPSDVTSYPIIDAMMTVPREVFLPPERREAAYLGENVELGSGRVLFDPRTFAKMLEAAEIRGTDLVLDLAAAPGYSSAVIARLAEAVIAVDDADRLAAMETALSGLGADTVVTQAAALTEGAPEHGPYDVIMVEGAVQVLPEAITDQLKDGGRIVCLFMEGALGVVRTGLKVDGRISWRFAFNASAPVLPGFEKQSAFTL